VAHQEWASAVPPGVPSYRTFPAVWGRWVADSADSVWLKKQREAVQALPRSSVPWPQQPLWRNQQ